MENVAGICPVCHQAVLDTYYFCPNCGHGLKEKPTPVSILTQVGLYVLAIFLPPFGLYPGIKYLKKNFHQAKMVGLITTALTLVSTFVMIWWIFYFMNKYLNEVSGALYGF